MVIRRIPSRPTGEIDEAKSKRYPDGSAFLVYTSGALALVGKRAPYSIDPPLALVDVERECSNTESDGEESSIVNSM